MTTTSTSTSSTTDNKDEVLIAGEATKIEPVFRAYLKHISTGASDETFSYNNHLVRTVGITDLMLKITTKYPDVIIGQTNRDGFVLEIKKDPNTQYQSILIYHPSVAQVFRKSVAEVAWDIGCYPPKHATQVTKMIMDLWSANRILYAVKMLCMPVEETATTCKPRYDITTWSSNDSSHMSTIDKDLEYIISRTSWILGLTQSQYNRYIPILINEYDCSINIQNID